MMHRTHTCSQGSDPMAQKCSIRVIQGLSFSLVAIEHVMQQDDGLETNQSVSVCTLNRILLLRLTCKATVFTSSKETHSLCFHLQANGFFVWLEVLKYWYEEVQVFHYHPPSPTDYSQERYLFLFLLSRLDEMMTIFRLQAPFPASCLTC